MRDFASESKTPNMFGSSNLNCESENNKKNLTVSQRCSVAIIPPISHTSASTLTCSIIHSSGPYMHARCHNLM